MDVTQCKGPEFDPSREKAYSTKACADPHCLPASARDRWPGDFPNGVFIHLYLCEQQSCWTRVKIQYSPIRHSPQNVSVLVNPPSKCLFYKLSKTMWNHKHSVK